MLMLIQYNTMEHPAKSFWWCRRIAIWYTYRVATAAPAWGTLKKSQLRIFLGMVSAIFAPAKSIQNYLVKEGTGSELIAPAKSIQDLFLFALHRCENKIK